MQSSCLTWRALLVIALAPVATLAQSSDGQVAVGVRTQLDRQKVIWDGAHSHKLENAPEHGKVYAILMIQPTQSPQKLVKPVNAAALRDELVRQLESHGYHHVLPNQRPEILLSVIYGRSWLPNPYFTDKINVDNMGPELKPYVADRITHEFGPDGMVPDTPGLATELSIPSNSHKATKANLEKLFILVRAFKYPPPVDPKQKPEVLWVATMFVDNPENQDLNLVIKQMLEAGAPYFDKEIPGKEVEIWKPLPEGHVKVGAPEVVESAKSSGK